MNRAIQYGDGLFETILCQNQTPSFWPEHWSRLQLGASKLMLNLKPEEYYLDLIQNAAKVISSDWSIVKIIVYRSGTTRGYRPLLDVTSSDIVLSDTASAEALGFQQAISLCVCDITLPEDRALAGIKHLNRLHQVLAAAQCETAGFQDGIVLDHAHNVIETTCANLLWLCDDILHTPQIETAGVAGIGAAVVLNAWQKQGGRVATGHYTLEALRHARVIMTVNSVRGVRPVMRIECAQLQSSDWSNAMSEASDLQKLFFTELERSWQNGYANSLHY
jgi:4-amino-4-deoxychorismate lyase